MGTGEVVNGFNEHGQPVCQGHAPGSHCGQLPAGAFVFIGLNLEGIPTLALMASCSRHRGSISNRARTYAISDGAWADAEHVVELVELFMEHLADCYDSHSPEPFQLAC